MMSEQRRAHDGFQGETLNLDGAVGAGLRNDLDRRSEKVAP